MIDFIKHSRMKIKSIASNIILGLCSGYISALVIWIDPELTTIAHLFESGVIEIFLLLTLLIWLILNPLYQLFKNQEWKWYGAAQVLLAVGIGFSITLLIIGQLEFIAVLKLIGLLFLVFNLAVLMGFLGARTMGNIGNRLLSYRST